MERKSIGAFIAALRKANGLTQQELAKRLNVSDKTVSRWERNEGNPDLTLIPVIAEIFDVTCDELLQGERNPNTLQNSDVERGETTQRAKKQRQRLLAASLATFQNRCVITAGVAVFGFVVALSLNLGFQLTLVGFMATSACLMIALVLQTTALISALAGVADVEKDSDIYEFRKKLVFYSERIYCIILLVFFLVLPLLFAGAWMGIASYGLFAHSIAYIIAGGLVCCVACIGVNTGLVKKGFIYPSEKERLAFQKRTRLQTRCLSVFSIVLTISILAQFGFNTYVTGMYNSEASYTSYHSYEDFLQAVDELNIQNGVAPDESDIIIYVGLDPSSESCRYFDAEENELTEEEYLALAEGEQNILFGYLEMDADGNILCMYYLGLRKNLAINFSSNEDGEVLITLKIGVPDEDAYKFYSSVGNLGFSILYSVEGLIYGLIYLRKRARRDKV